MTYIRPKKHLGQHFLTNTAIADKIVASVNNNDLHLLEIGPGTGVLTKQLIKKDGFLAVDVDRESVEYLKKQWPEYADKIILEDFLKSDISKHFPSKFSIIGNFPYNISSQIFFKVLEVRNQVEEVVCMIQKEVAERIACPPGSKTYGILSVLLQAFYSIEYLFTVHENAFNPPPKVKSGVIRLTRNKVEKLDCNEQKFKTIVKTSFNQRRKTIRNSLRSLAEGQIDSIDSDFLSKRPEQLSINDFVLLTRQFEKIQ